MNRDAIFLRDAGPTRDDGLAFAHFLDEAADGFFRLILGREAAEIIAKAYVRSGNEYSFENAIFAVRDDAIVGMACGFSGRRRRGFSDQPLKYTAGRHAARIAVAGFLLSRLKRILEHVADDDFYLLAIAVDEKFRGLGAGSLLLHAMEVRAAAGGSSRLALDVSARNEEARLFYERHGMTSESDWPDLEFVPTIFSRMSKVLGVGP